MEALGFWADPKSASLLNIEFTAWFAVMAIFRSYSSSLLPSPVSETNLDFFACRIWLPPKEVIGFENMPDTSMKVS